MSRPAFRLTAGALGVVIAVAGCGSGSGGGEDDSPKGELVSSVQALSDSDVLTTTIQLETTPADLQQLSASSGDPLNADTAQAISEGQIVIENVNGDESTKAVSIRVIDGDVKLIELRVVEGDLYAQGDVEALLTVSHSTTTLSDLEGQTAQAPAFVQAFLRGDWVSLKSEALKSLTSQFGAPTSSSDSSKGPQVLAELRKLLDRDVTVKKVGSDEEEGDHLVLTGNLRKLATDLQAAVTRAVPGGSAFSNRLDSSSAPDRQITLDAWVKDDALSKLSLDLVQFAEKGDVPEGTTLPITLTFEQSGDDIPAPSGATDIDLSQLGSLLQGFGS